MIQIFVFILTIFIHLNALAEDAREFGVRLPDKGLYCHATAFCGGVNAKYEDCRWRDDGRMEFGHGEAGQIWFWETYHAGGLWGGGNVSHHYTGTEQKSVENPDAVAYSYQDRYSHKTRISIRPVVGQPDTYLIFKYYWHYGYICR